MEISEMTILAISEKTIILIVIAVFILGAINIVLAIFAIISARSKKNLEQINTKLDLFERELDKFGRDNKDEFARNRTELGDKIKELTAIVDEKLHKIQEGSSKTALENREELRKTLKDFEERFVGEVKSLQKAQETLTKNTTESMEKVRESVEKKLADIQTDNSKKLEEMRVTVDEKLHKTLENRLGESFKIVSERLEQVQKGLGEMQSLATGVGDLKKVLSNVKTKGVLGEYQLAALLEQLLTASQYEANVKTKKGSNALVEFAVKIPNKDENKPSVWLPIDAKFPSEDYERLMEAYDTADPIAVAANVKGLETKIKNFAKDIKDKYIDVPNTTDFAIMFLPFEGLFAEVLRIPGLFQKIQTEYKVVITGPTTISALLNSLQIGFRSLAVEKRTSEVWEVLGAAKTEFGKFADVIAKVKKKINDAGAEIDKIDVRSRAIDRKLKNVQELPQEGGDSLIEDIQEVEFTEI